MSEDGLIKIRGAREHNLKNISLDLPRNKISVITGLSGSGKSSLAFDTIYAEGQRRYIESLSSFARQFMDQLKKPEVDVITGLSPSISIEQKTTTSSPRSTVGTVTEIYDFLRLLYARVGEPHCYNCGKSISSQTIDQMADLVLNQKVGAKLHLLAPVIRAKKGEYLAEFRKWIRQGFVRARIDGEVIELAHAQKLEKNKSHNIDLFVDRLIVNDKIGPRVKEGLNTALRMASGFAKVEVLDTGEIIELSSANACVQCGISYPEIEPRLFSFNNPRGACTNCNGLGYIGEEAEEESGDDEEERKSEASLETCGECKGQRLRPEALSIFIAGKNISNLCRLSGFEMRKFLASIEFTSRSKEIASKVLKEVVVRLDFLTQVGVDYLSIDRPSRTLSGGESQRIRLASQIGSGLVGVLYVLDEPSIGLHPRDHGRLLTTLRSLSDKGNTVLLVEHDEETIRKSDFVVDLGPGAGKHGGSLISTGAPEEISKDPKSVTGAFLSGRTKIPVPKSRRKGSGFSIKLTGTTGNNLKNVSLEIPLGTLVGISGVSGSGKSTLIIDTLYPALENILNKSARKHGPFESIEGAQYIDKIIEIDQAPIGRTPRSNPATYTGLFTLVRDLFSQLPDSKVRGYKPGRFSFNVKGGRCETCEGAGVVKVEMHFLPNVYVPCDVCLSQRYNRETLDIKFKGKNIADVLAMEITEALVFFENVPLIKSRLSTLTQVGLGYLSLGQSSTTLSGGEAQRVKLSRELAKRSTGRTLYIFDEPTTGLHFEDVRKLLEIINSLVDQGNTVIIIEHNLDVLKSADYLIDLGPDGGINGGQIIASGTPEAVSKVRESYTGEYLKPLL